MQGSPATLGVAEESSRADQRPRRETGQKLDRDLDESAGAGRGVGRAVPLPMHPALAGLVPLRAGGVLAVDSAALALALVAGVSRAGEWIAVAGWPDLGAQAAADLGIALDRTIWVPHIAGEHWLEVTAALVDVVRMLVLVPPRGARGTSIIDARTAGVVEARLRSRGAALVVWGDWPRCGLRASLEDSRWSGPDDGLGRLQRRHATLVVRRSAGQAVRADLQFADDVALRRVGPEPSAVATGGVHGSVGAADLPRVAAR